MNVLVVEDDKQVALSVKKTLSVNKLINFVDTANSFDQAFDKIYSDVFDLLLLDIFLGEDNLTGLDLCAKIREKNKKIPIIILTSINSIKYLEKAFKLGANDYIRKPFNSRELEIRIERWLQLSENFVIKKQLNYKELTYDFHTNKFYFNNKALKMTKKNKFLLRLFLKNPEKLLSSAYIKEKFWGDYPGIRKNRNLRSNIQCLRSSLSPYCADWLKTERGEGYILKK
jgi:DNA-binding response OmpR family regulator